MSTDNRKTENTSPRSDKQDEKIADLPISQTTEQDAQQVKGGGRKKGVGDDSV